MSKVQKCERLRNAIMTKKNLSEPSFMFVYTLLVLKEVWYIIIKGSCQPNKALVIEFNLKSD